MLLNNKELRTIERALGMVIAVTDCLDGPKANTLAVAVSQIDDMLSQAEKRECAEKLTYQQTLDRSLYATGQASTATTVHNLHIASEVGE